MTAARRLAAILAVNVVGNSRLMGEGEEGTVQPHRAGSKSGMVAHGCRWRSRGGGQFGSQGATVRKTKFRPFTDLRQLDGG